MADHSLMTNIMTRTDIINILIKFYGYKSYVEIGVDEGVNIKAINIKYKVGVDPDPKTKIYYPDVKGVTSDTYFNYMKKKGIVCDILFIDGLHEAPQVYKDINNALDVLNRGGTIVCHDMLPTEEIIQHVPRQQKVWTGDCWKAWVQIRSENEHLCMQVVDADYGCGIIRRGKQKLITYKKLDYDSFVANKQEWMNIISIDEFSRKFKI